MAGMARNSRPRLLAGMGRTGQATHPKKEAKKIEGAANWYSDIL